MWAILALHPLNFQESARLYLAEQLGIEWPRLLVDVLECFQVDRLQSEDLCFWQLTVFACWYLVCITLFFARYEIGVGRYLSGLIYCYNCILLMFWRFSRCFLSHQLLKERRLLVLKFFNYWVDADRETAKVACVEWGWVKLKNPRFGTIAHQEFAFRHYFEFRLCLFCTYVKLYIVVVFNFSLTCLLKAHLNLNVELFGPKYALLASVDLLFIGKAVDV